MPSIEPGYSTTEFWVSTVTAACTLIFALLADFGVVNFSAQQRTDISAAAVLAVTLIAAGYSIARGLRKKGLLG
jgi:hypothetical protein